MNYQFISQYASAFIIKPLLIDVKRCKVVDSLPNGERCEAMK